MDCIDLFCGCGGLSKGFLNAGFNIVAAYENWDAAIQCYKKNFNHNIYKLDLHDWEKAADNIKNIEPSIIIGGPPCQDFSPAGNRIEGKRAQLTVSFAKIVNLLKPRYFVMENVVRANKSEAYKTARQLFKVAGYGLTEKTLNANYCGVPQNRKRFFCIGGLNEDDGFLDGVLAANLSEFPLTLHEYAGDKLNFEYYYRHPRTYDRRGIFSIYEPAPTIRGSNRPIPPEYKRHPQDAIDPQEGVRALTFRERALIQTFPEDFVWLNSPTINNQLIGNAVPVKLAEYVARCIRDYTEKTFNLRDVGFVDWLKKEKSYTARAACDVLSRVRRIKRMAMQCTNNQSSDLLEVIEKTDNFTALSKSVKSQLRRAYILYCEYTALSKGGE